MGRKKRRGATLKPFCYYCDREFDDEKVLIQHQKAKHFKCSQCARKLDTATGLAVHLLQVHKEQITRVPNALSGRDAIEVIVHGMEGVPQETIDERLSRQTKKNEGKESQKRQRVNWAQVTMAPTSMEQFALQAQQGILPTFVGLPSLVPDPAAAPALGGVSLPFPPAIAPGLAPSLPAPPNIQGLLGPAAASVPVGVAGAAVPGAAAAPALALLGGLGLGAAAAVGAAAAAGRTAPAAGGPAPSAATPLGGGAPGVAAAGAPAAAPLPPGRPPTNFSAPPLPANVSLMYNDDMISMEERRAHETCAYVGEAMA